jgi:CheY-like chemotaxis protein
MQPVELKADQVPPVQPRLLVVDDEPVVCESCRRILTGRGFTVETSTDSRTGLRMAEQGDYDAILLDLQMPYVDGVRFLERLRECGKNVPVVIITGQGGQGSARQIERLGAREYVPKPFTPAELSEAVWRVVQGAGI